jgi:16S rRNA (guanine966-N2)-methyltransferase
MIRLSAGLLKGRSIDVPTKKTTRPSTNKVKMAIFNILIHRFQINFQDIAVIDLFAGSGALGLEAISLGATNTLFIDKDYQSCEYIYLNCKKLSILDRVTILRMDATQINNSSLSKVFQSQIVSLVFIDPPYKNKNLLKKIVYSFRELRHIGPDTLCLIETDDQCLQHEALLIEHKTSYGNTCLYFAKVNF